MKDDDDEDSYFVLEVLGITPINEDEKVIPTDEDKFINNMIIVCIIVVMIFIGMIIKYV